MYIVLGIEYYYFAVDHVRILTSTISTICIPRLKRYDHARFQLSQSNSETIGLNYDGCILYSLMFPVQ